MTVEQYRKIGYLLHILQKVLHLKRQSTFNLAPGEEGSLYYLILTDLFLNLKGGMWVSLCRKHNKHTHRGARTDGLFSLPPLHCPTDGRGDN